MSIFKKIVVAVSAEENIADLLIEIREMNFLTQSEIHFVNVFNTITYSVTMSSGVLIYPIESDRKEIESLVMKNLYAISEKVLPRDFKGKVVLKSLFADSTKDKFVQYVNEEKASLVIVAKREKKGFFESSFAQFVNKHTKANLLLLKVG